MAKRPGGLDPVEVTRGFEAIASAKSIDDLCRAIDKTPVLRNPVFHAILDANAAAPFFMTLALYVYLAHCRNAVKGTSSASPGSQRDHWPPFYKAVCEQLKGKVPGNYPHCLEPSRDIERLVFEIEEATKGHVTLPEYRPTQGSTWSALVVRCPTCEEQRVEVFTNRIDLTMASDLMPAVREGRINHPSCPRCAQTRCYPIRVWIREEPGPEDTIGSMTGILRLNEDSWIYLPPPGTPRVPHDERLYEIRAMNLLKTFKWQMHATGAASIQTSMSIAYDEDDLCRLASAIVSDRAESELPVAIPSAMKGFWDAVARNLRSGLWPLVEARKIVAETVSAGGQDWPLLLDVSLDSLENNRRLALSLIRECLAERAHEDPFVRVRLKLDTFKALLRKSQLGLADATLREAQGLLQTMPASAPERSLLERLSALCRVELLDAQGRNLEASEVETEVMAGFAGRGQSIDNEILELRTASAVALKLKHEGRLLEALKALRHCVSGWTDFLERLSNSSADAPLQRLEMCATSLSSDRANLANVLDQFRQYVKVQRILGQLAQGVAPSDEDRLWMEEMTPIVKAAFDVVNDAAFDELEDLLGSVSEKRLWDRSLALLEQALGLATQIPSWELAAIQAHNMAMLLFEGKVFDHAESYMRRAVDYAERSGDDIRIVQGCGLLARLASKRGAGEETIQWAKKAIETYGRNLLSRGHAARPNLGLQRLLARLTLEAVAAGGQSEQAVVLVENLKSLTLANSLFAERPDQRSGTGPASSADTTSDLDQRLEEIRLRAMFGADEPQGEGEASGIEQRVRALAEERSVQDPRFATWVDASDFALTTVAGLRQRLGLLGDRTTFLGAFYDGFDLWTYALWSDGASVFKTSLSRGALPVGEVQATQLEHLSTLSDAVLQPLIDRRAAVTGGDRLVLSSCPEIYTLPIPALSFRGKPLVESFVVNVVQGAGVFEACIRRPFNKLESLLCLGNPSRPDLPSLERAEEEVKILDSRFRARGKEVKRLLGPRATVPQFVDGAGASDICHLACHAEFEATGGRLRLAPDLARKDSGELTEMRILTEVKVKPGALVNLAGCSTAIQRETGTAMIGGLVPVWMLAGASGVVATLWPIRDELARIFQEQLYQRLLDGSRPEEALALTQRDCIAGQLGETMQSPEAWAAFQFYGCLIPSEAKGFL